MSLQLSQKERTLLEDGKSHEEICIQKYNNYSNQAHDPQLKQLFKDLAGSEQGHFNSINQLLSGQIPNISGNYPQPVPLQNSGTPQPMAAQDIQHDKALCTDMLMTEKYVSSSYNTSIFEMRDTNLRKTLNHIQAEEQQHGESIYNYMQSKGMYKVQ